VEIRAATDADWPGIWSFLGPVLAAGETYTYPRDISQAQARSEWLPSARWPVVVATEDERVLGVGKYGPNQPGAGSHVANASFVVDPALGGRGVGRALAVHVLAAARADGFRAMQFNAVVETNAAAVALWESLGFRTLAVVPEAFAHPTAGLVGLRIMHRFL
jgi:L-amino acid N-acyltransferase YncA